MSVDSIFIMYGVIKNNPSGKKQQQNKNYEPGFLLFWKY